MSSYTTRTSSYSYTQPKAAPAPAIDTNAIISEAERRCGNMIKQRMDSLQTAIDAQYLVMSREAINIRAEQSRELDKIRKDTEKKLADMEKEAKKSESRLEKSIETKIASVYKTIDETASALRKESKAQFDAVNGRIDKVAQEINAQKDKAAARAKEMKLRMELAEASLKAVENMEPHRFEGITDELERLESVLDSLKDAVRRGSSDELVAAYDIMERAIKLEKKAYIQNLEYMERTAQIEAVNAMNQGVIDYLEKSRFSVGFDFEGQKHEAEVDIKNHSDTGIENLWDKMTALHRDCMTKTESGKAHISELEGIYADAKRVSDMVGALNGDGEYSEGVILKTARDNAYEQRLKELAAQKTAEQLRKNGFVQYEKESGFINGKGIYPYYIKAVDSRRNEYFIAIDSRDKKLSVYTHVFGDRLKKEDRTRKSGTLAANVCDILGAEKPEVNENCDRVDTPEKFESYIREETAKALTKTE